MFYLMPTQLLVVMLVIYSVLYTELNSFCDRYIISSFLGWLRANNSIADALFEKIDNFQNVWEITKYLHFNLFVLLNTPVA